MLFDERIDSGMIQSPADNYRFWPNAIDSRDSGTADCGWAGALEAQTHERRADGFKPVATTEQ